MIIALLAGIVAGGVAQSIWVLLLVLAAVLAIAVPTVEYLDRRWRDSILLKMQTVSDDIAQIVSNPEAESEETSEAMSLEAETLTSPAARLDLDDLEAPEAGGNRDGQRSRA
jgi:hypothetical protein